MATTSLNTPSFVMLACAEVFKTSVLQLARVTLCPALL